MTQTDLFIAYKKETCKYPPHSTGARYSYQGDTVKNYKEYTQWLETKLIALIGMIDGTSIDKDSYKELIDLLSHGN